MQRREYRFDSNNNPFSSVLGVIFMVLALVALFIVARFIVRILYFVAPLILIAAAIIDYKVIVDYVKWLVRLTKKNTLMGIGSIALSVIFYPFVGIFLLGKALFKRRVRQAEEEQRQMQEGEYIDFEDVSDDTLELPRMEKSERKEEKKDDRYDQFFE
jgi:vacuolar-type H+-ATPase subunit I/STV1